MSQANRDPWTGEVRPFPKMDEAAIEARLAAAAAAFPPAATWP